MKSATKFKIPAAPDKYGAESVFEAQETCSMTWKMNPRRKTPHKARNIKAETGKV